MASSLGKIVSGGQTGVDRGALDAALDAGFSCGGWCGADHAAEDGPIDPRYPLTGLATGGYAERTLKNVLDSDGTAILYFRELEGGTHQTMLHCVRHRKPHHAIDAAQATPEAAAAAIGAFIAANDIAVLNIAGPRASKWPGAHAYACAAVRHLLRAHEKHRPPRKSI